MPESNAEGGTIAFLDAVEAMWKGLDLKDVHGMLLGVHDAEQLASSGLSVLTELLHMFRHFVGSRTPEWWNQTLEGSKVNSVASDEAVAILSLVAAQAGGLTLPELAPLERPALLPTYLQLSVVVAVLIHFHGRRPMERTLDDVRTLLLGPPRGAST